jgi:hypothetical protein
MPTPHNLTVTAQPDFKQLTHARQPGNRPGIQARQTIMDEIRRLDDQAQVRHNELINLIERFTVRFHHLETSWWESKFSISLYLLQPLKHEFLAHQSTGPSQ